VLGFFGLTPKYVEGVYEEIFQLKYHGGFSIFESYNLPVGIRRWFLKRLSKQFRTEAENYEKAKKKHSRR
jgi:hypothetical protein